MDSRAVYLPGLDGLRALAVIAVLIYHARPGWLPGGFLGVEVFFVISGFIITRALLLEWQQNRQISLTGFWLRRARRLLPAVLLLLAGVLVYALAFEPHEVTRLRADVIASLAYVVNWHLILDNQSYFDSFLRPSMLQHLWSLAVEEQFYIVWPVVMAFGLFFLRQKGLLVLIILGIAASSLGMALLYNATGDVSRVYFGTDTRAAGLLVGAALAFVFAGGPARVAGASTPYLLALVGVAGLAALAFATYWLNETRPVLYQGGFLAVALCTAVVIVAASRGGPFASVLSLAPLRWVGVRSYAIYLWHWPIYMTAWPAEPTLQQLAWQLPAIVLLSAVSYAIVEQPVRRGALGRLWLKLKGWPGLTLRYRAGFSLAGTGAVAALAGLVTLTALARPPAVPDYFGIPSLQIRNVIVATDAGGMVAAPPSAMDRVQTTLSSLTTESRVCPYQKQEPDPLQGDEGLIWGTGCPVPMGIFQAPAAARPPDGVLIPIHIAPRESDMAALWAPPEPLPLASRSPVRIVPPGPPAPPHTPQEEGGGGETPVPGQSLVLEEHRRVTAIGDSVMLGAAYALAGSIPGLELDSSVGRQATDVVALLRDMAARGALGEVVILQVGNNGTLTGSQFDEMMEAIGSHRQVIVINLHVPRAWQDSNNQVIHEGVGRWANAHLVDWSGAASMHDGLVHTDGTHLTPSGGDFYAQLVLDTLGSF